MSPIPRSVLVLIDVQQEYVTSGRPFHLKGIAPSLQNIWHLLAHARSHSWSIIHVRHVQDGPVFARDNALSDFVEGFGPRAGETVVIKSKLSAFTQPEFAVALDAAGTGEVFVVGYGSTMCCLATIVDAPLFGRRLTFVHDASWARAPDAGFDEAQTHRHATAILAIHGKLASTADLLARPAGTAS